jgi:glutaredoxin
MKEIKIYDPALCCPTGLCGVNIDPELMRIAVVVETLKRKGISIERFNLRDHPQVYVANKVINDFLMKEGAEKLPVTTVDGKVEITGAYPTNAQIAEWLGIDNLELRIKN